MSSYQGITYRQLIGRIPTLAKDCITNNLIKRFTTLPPTVMQLNITWKCNSRCVMCNIWKKEHTRKELNAEQLDHVFSDDLFKNIECVEISGGEPTLRNDLPQIVDILHLRMPRMKKIIIFTNGLSKRIVSEQLPQIIEYCNNNNILITVRVSLDGIGEVQNRVRNIPHAFEKTVDTIYYLKELQDQMDFRFGIGTTISSINVYNLVDIVNFCKKEDLDVIFFMAWVSETYYDNIDQEEQILLDSEAKKFLIDFLLERIAESPFLKGDAYYYAKVVNMLKGDRRRTMPCPFIDQGFVLDALGDIYYCNNSKKIGNVFLHTPTQIYYKDENLAYRDELAKATCPTCESSCLVGISLEKQIFPFLPFLLRRICRQRFL